MPIKRTDADLIAAAPGLLTRLGRHLSAVESGAAGAGDDLAAVLRILLDKTNPGNRGMARIAAAIGVDLPAVVVSGAPQLSGTALLMSFGNLPVVPAPGDGQPHTPRSLPFQEWVDTPSLVVPGSEKRRESWGSFSTLIANTGGAHLGTTYHDLLATSDLFQTLGLSLQDYLLRQIGWQVERVLADLIAHTGHGMIPRTRELTHWPRTPVWMVFRDQPGTGMEAAVSISVNDNSPLPIEVMRFVWRGRVNHLIHGGTGPDGKGLPARLVVDNPDTGEATATEGEPRPPGWKPPDDWHIIPK